MRRQTGDRYRATDAERCADNDAKAHAVAGDADRRERPHREGEHEGRETEAEQDAVEPAGKRQRHDPTPAFRDLPADLRGDPHSAPVGDCGRGGDNAGEYVPKRSVAVAEKLAEEREATKRDDATEDRTDRKRRDRQ